MRVPLEKIAMSDRRRAARALESLLTRPPGNGSSLGKARLGAEAAPVYRPDMKDVAYWEFEVEGIRTSLPVPGEKPKQFDRGFILVATGAHDVPIPHFSLDLAPPSRRLEHMGKKAQRIVKVDSQCYAAEDARGELQAHLGMMPPRLDGMPKELTKTPPEGWATTATRTGNGPRTDDATSVEKTRPRQSREERPVKPQPWESWQELKDGYSTSYRPHLKALAERAAHPWGIDALTEKFGQGIHSGEVFPLPMLEPGQHELKGPGAPFVTAELVSDAAPPRLLLTAKADIDEKDLTFEVIFSYASGEETLMFFIVPFGAPTTVVPEGSPLGPTFERTDS